MSKKIYNLIVLFAALLFVVLNSYLVYNEKTTMLLLPVVLLVVLFVLFAPDLVFYSLFLFAPMSVPLRALVPGLEFDLWFPTEPLILALLLVLVLKSLYTRYFERNISDYPVFWAIVLYLGWLIIASIGSQMPLVSVKYTLVRIWFIVIFFYLSYLILLRDTKNIYRMMWLYMSGLIVVVLISLVRQAQRGLLNRYVAHGVCVPFFPDHTSYGAALAFIIPIALAMAVSVRKNSLKLLLYSLSGFFIIALVLTFTRAAWLSLVLTGGIWVVWRLRIKLRTILLTAVAVVALVVSFWGDIVRWMSSNDTASSGGLKEQVMSITNITTDDSNVERINRWTCALRMFREKPILGFGPGTYQFLYSPYQSSYLLTKESSHQGKKGNAHSEYLGLMSEGGIVAAVAFVLIIAFTIIRAFKMSRRLKACPERTMVVGMLMGFITYVAHGVMNNFLEMDKLALLFWVTTAFVLAVDAKLLKIEAED